MSFSKSKPKTAIRPLVIKAEFVMPNYPTHFSDIEAVKVYIADACRLDLGYPVQDKVAFIVAVRALENGEFYLDTPLRDCQALRDAIERAINVNLPQIKIWPGAFRYVGEAERFITVSTTSIQKISFGDIDDAQFQGYVRSNTARRSWEHGNFELRHVPKGWRHKPSLSSLSMPQPATLDEAVTLNLSHLAPLLPPWPDSFSDLNAARDYVEEFCFNFRFRYSYFDPVEKGRFRCIVHYTTAKDALKADKFALDDGGERVRIEDVKPVLKKQAVNTGSAGSIESGENKEEDVEVEVKGFTVSKKAYGSSRSKNRPFVKTSYEEFRTRAAVKDAGTVEGDDEENELPRSPADSMEPLMPIEEVEEEEHKLAEPVAVVKREKFGSFAALVADLRREFILKAAFD